VIPGDRGAVPGHLPSHFVLRVDIAGEGRYYPQCWLIELWERK
jgi:hypothetical protein